MTALSFIPRKVLKCCRYSDRSSDYFVPVVADVLLCSRSSDAFFSSLTIAKYM